MNNMFYSSAHQDKFVYNILNKNNNGYFIDIGSNEPIIGNNSYFLESVGWNGICIEVEKLNYSSRKCNYINFNAVELSYKYLFLEHKVPKIIDYLSLDIDENTTDCLEKMPLDRYQFKVITIEHDSYRFGTVPRDVQRKILQNAGYYLLCQDLTCPPLFNTQYFEDWWINPKFIDTNHTKYLKCQGCTTESVVEKFD